ncbi:hypothetical protein E2562_030718, partial [Oryza meyeriana var. granulata]
MPRAALDMATQDPTGHLVAVFDGTLPRTTAAPLATISTARAATVPFAPPGTAQRPSLLTEN